MDLTWRNVKTSTQRRSAPDDDRSESTTRNSERIERQFKFIKGRQRIKRQSQPQKPEKDFQSVLRANGVADLEDAAETTHLLAEDDAAFRFAPAPKKSAMGAIAVEDIWTPSSSSNDGMSLFQDDVPISSLPSPSQFWTAEHVPTPSDCEEIASDEISDHLPNVTQSHQLSWDDAAVVDQSLAQLYSEDIISLDQEMVVHQPFLSPGVLFRDLGHKFVPILEQCEPP